MKTKLMRTLLVFALCLSLSTLTFAQLQIGVKAGINSSYQSSPPAFSALTQNPAVENSTTTNSHLIRYQAGISLKYALNEHFKLQTDISFNQMGGTFTSLVTDINGVREEADLTTKVTYNTLPINVQNNIVPKWSIDAGPQIGFRIDGEPWFELIDLNDFDFGFNFGTTFAITDQLDFQFRYYLGLLSTHNLLFTDFNGEPLEDIEFRNRSLQFSVIYYPFAI
jgi:hypothetical protein